MKKALTDKWIKGGECVLPPGMACLDVYDVITPGLSLRVSKSMKSWSYAFQQPGLDKRARMGLGTYCLMVQPDRVLVSLDDARKAAMAARAQVEKGLDPRMPVFVPQLKTMAELCAERLELECSGMRSATDIKRRYDKYIVAVVGQVAVADFRLDPDYNACLDPLKKSGKKRQAGVVHSDLQALMNFAKSRGVIEFSRIDAAKSVDPKNERKRSLSTDEIVAFWHELPKAIIRSRDVQRILRLELVMGQRSGEVCGMHRTELDFGKRLWRIPAARVKNGDDYGDHIVPLSDLAISIIREAFAVNSNDTDWAFPNEAKDGPYDPRVVASTLRRSVEAGDFSIPKFIPHDLRRTVGTQMLAKANGLGISKFQKYLVLNHMSAIGGNVSDDHYDGNDYTAEYTDLKREALVKWGDFLAQLVGAETGLRRVA